MAVAVVVEEDVFGPARGTSRPGAREPHGPPTRLPISRPPLPDSPEFAVYAALKLHHCELALRGQQTQTITARWLQHFLERLGHSSQTIAELHGVTSQFVRERLANLNHGEALRETGAGLRNAVSYAWTEVIGPSTLASYRSLCAALEGRAYLAIDTYRIQQCFHQDRFVPAEYMALFQELRERALQRRWYRLTAQAPTRGADYATFLARRLRELDGLKVLDREGSERWLSAKGDDVSAWFGLVIHSVDYPRTP